MALTTPEKQQKINELLADFIQMSSFTPNQHIGLAIQVCNTLNSVSDDQHFLPRYYTISNSLLEFKNKDDDMYDRSSSLRKLLLDSENFLKTLTTESQLCKEQQGLKHYCEDDVFRHLVNEFYSSAQHEIIIYEASVMGKNMAAFPIAQDEIKARFSEMKSGYDALLETVNKEIVSTRKLVSNANDKLQQVKDILPNLLTTLGIFVSIIIAVVAIYLNIILCNNSSDLIETFFAKLTVQSRIITVLFFGLFTFDLLFVFVYWIAKISGRSIACHCMGCGEDGVCKPKKCKAATRAFKRYWNFFVVNILTVVIMLILLVVHIHGLSNETCKDVQDSTPTYTIDVNNTHNDPYTCTENVKDK